jgi:hypothetical protein
MKFSGLTIVAPRFPSSRATYRTGEAAAHTSTPPARFPHRAILAATF